MYAKNPCYHEGSNGGRHSDGQTKTDFGDRFISIDYRPKTLQFRGLIDGYDRGPAFRAVK